ncbi:pilus assembly FimT family protein [Marinobacter persicus]|uniref:MSHA pilin protein MshC n=1 Tax=Marinobacter persicus TaxID=930118 RepID=A0A2S6G4N3_9GAMM|nr:type II secretion system protein [Marinobacter persicus]PPK51812.1 MSHA pilin protein MshC [Marinobacter persicus]PPK53934.1 MSHA pilin protein MshC [Marinobacter persicus]PPK58743.1 MSHA pilin protein MshC [Marinobacter persicus]
MGFKGGIVVRDCYGFTLIELITVIILIGVLSALGIGLFARSSAFSPMLVTQQLASATLLAQQAALAGQPNASVRIEHPAGSEPVFRAQFDPDGPGSTPPFILQEFTLPTGGVSITVNGNATPQSIDFDKLGRPADRTNRDISISGDSNFQVCVSSLGAVYGGVCSG